MQGGAFGGLPSACDTGAAGFEAAVHSRLRSGWRQVRKQKLKLYSGSGAAEAGGRAGSVTARGPGSRREGGRERSGMESAGWKGVMQLRALPAHFAPTGKEPFMASTQGQLFEKRSWEGSRGGG